MTTTVAAEATRPPVSSEERPSQTLADLLHALGDIAPERIRLHPPIGTATEDDLEGLRNCELVDGTIVEKAVGYLESCLGALLIGFLHEYLKERDLGFVAGADALSRFGSNARAPDVAFVRWEQVPDEEIPDVGVAAEVPQLAVEVLSRGNTRREIERKRGEYFAAGVRLVWIVEPRRRTVEVWTAADRFVTLTEADVLDGGDVLPGFSLSIRDWFGKSKRRPKTE